MRIDFDISSWAAWAPGLTEQAAWKTWAAGEAPFPGPAPAEPAAAPAP